MNEYNKAYTNKHLFKNRKEAKEAMTLRGFNSVLVCHEFEWIPEIEDLSN